ncbi:MAG: twin-arginine translocase TatA/TatE family subunit [Apibacter sp.]|jgi:sec-independent protein translocase protein TatA|uniref:Sec-independent protein translocase protein TatA n=1 Tax=Apibacter mensalis TaxID=1586267 RepID=A0A0X3APD6_9FLAO|nr:twin-arginine translocase TatA/TatE family subunit [Apibacter mensalis]MCO6564837.1 twin-arginine translocase TatA/TatE family subunit [Apibacter sp.]CVK16216.1 sec-independent protein translocase protein TatA [Apibacter mensalis]
MRLFEHPMSIIIILVVVLLLFGGKKIPELMRGLGTGLKEFKDATKSDEDKKKETNSSANSKDEN